MAAGLYRRYLTDARRAAGLNGSLHNAAMVGWLVAINALPYALWALPMARNYISLIESIVMGAVAGIHIAFLLDTLPSVAGGDDELPEFAEFTNWQDSIIAPVIRFVFTAVFLLGPWLLWRFVTPHLALDPSLVSGVSWTLGAGGIALLPMGYIALCFGGLTAVLRLDALLLAIWRTKRAYALVLTMLALVLWAAVTVMMRRAPGVLTPVVTPQTALRVWRVLDVPVLAETVFVYTSVVMAMLLGVFQRHFGDRFPWSAA